MKLILIVIFIKSVIQILYNLYLFQIKEYRIDRFKEHISRKYPDILAAWTQLTFFAPISLKMLPRPTGKTILLFGISMLFPIVGYFGGLEYSIAGLLGSPFIVLFAIYTTLPLEWTMRQYFYKKASERIKTLKKDGLVVIGITGSYGKTTTKTFLANILSAKYKVFATPGSVNTPYGVVKTVMQSLNSSHDYFIVEMGAYKKGEIQELCDIVHPNIGILTGIGDQHISLFGSQQNIIQGKSELLQNLSDNTVYINADSEYKPVIPKGLEVVLYGKKDVKKHIGLLGVAPTPPFLHINYLPGILIALKTKISKTDIKSAISTIKPSERIIQEFPGYKNSTILRDPFTSSTTGVMSALEHLADKKGKKIVVMPCVVELGSKAPKAHQQIGKMFKKHDMSAVITTNDYFRDIYNASGKKKDVIMLTNTHRIIEHLKRIVGANTTLLLEGKLDKNIVTFLKQ